MRSRVSGGLGVSIVGVLLLSGCVVNPDASRDAVAAPADLSGSGPGLSFEPAHPRAGDAVRFHAGPHADLGVFATAWDFGDGIATTAADPVHVYAKPGMYAVTLRLKVLHGAELVNTGTVLVDEADEAAEPAAEAASEPGVQVAMTFGAPVRVQGNNGGEPSLAIDSAGRYFVNTINGIYRSTDGGARFVQLSNPNFFHSDSHVIVDKDDRVWVSDLQALITSSVSTSNNHGDGWQNKAPAASDTLFNDRQWVAATSGGKGYLLYRHCTVFLGVACITIGSLMTKTTDAGLTWVPITPVRTFQWTSYPFANKNDDTLYVVQSTGNGINVDVSTNGGSAWTSRVVANRATNTGNIFVNGAVDDAGNAYIAWTDKDSNQYDVYMAYSTNRGQNWKGPFLVSAGVGTHIFPWIAAGGDGKVVVAWYGTTTVGNPNNVPGGTLWTVQAAQSLNAHDLVPVFTQAQVSPDTMHQGVICTNGAGCNGDRDLLDFFMVQVDPAGRAAVAYGEDDNTATTKAQFILQNGGPLSR